MTDPFVVAIDPGKTTGFAVSLGPDMHSFEVSHEDVPRTVYHYLGLSQQHKSLRQSLHIVTEMFTISARTTRTSVQYESLYLNGWLTYGPAGQYLVFQTPAQAKSLATNERLEALGWRRPSKGGHADDAARHLFTYLHKNNLAPELLAPAFEDVKEFD